MTGHDVDRLLRNPSVIRSRAMIKAIIGNARAMMSASPGLPALAKSCERTREGAPRSIAGIPSSAPQAEGRARQLKAQGYRFAGPASV